MNCDFSWPLRDPNEEDRKNLVEHHCRLDMNHTSPHRCLCGAHPEDDE